MNSTRTKAAPLKIKEISEAGEFSGYASVFGVVDSHQDIVMPGAFSRTLVDHKSKDRLPALLWQHKMDTPIGVFNVMREDDEGLYVEGQLLIDGDADAQKAHAHLKAGSVRGLSIGFSFFPDGSQYEFDSSRDAWLIREVNLWEVSIVTVPSNDEANVNDVKSAFSRGELPQTRELERALRKALGMSSREAKRLLADGMSGLAPKEKSNGLAELRELAAQINN